MRTHFFVGYDFPENTFQRQGVEREVYLCGVELRWYQEYKTIHPPLTILTNRPNKLFVLFEIEKSLLFRNVHYSDTSLSTILTESLF